MPCKNCPHGRSLHKKGKKGKCLMAWSSWTGKGYKVTRCKCSGYERGKLR